MRKGIYEQLLKNLLNLFDILNNNNDFCKPNFSI